MGEGDWASSGWKNSGGGGGGGELQPPNWAEIKQRDFKRVFLAMPRGEQDAEKEEDETRKWREAVGVRVEDKGSLPSAPAPARKFEDLPTLPRYVQKGLRDFGIKVPKPLQAQVLPVVLLGCNLVAVARPGSGITLSFLVPLAVHLEAQEPARDKTAPLALILAASTRVAEKIHDEACKVLRHSREGKHHKSSGLWSLLLPHRREQQEELRRQQWVAQILVATPRALVECIRSRMVCTEQVTYVALTDVDRMLADGWRRDIDAISAQVRPDRQVLMHTSAWNSEVEELAKSLCPKGDPPVRIASTVGLAISMADGRQVAGDVRVHEGISQEVIVVDHPQDNGKQAQEKESRLMEHIKRVLDEAKDHKVLIFVTFWEEADSLAAKVWDLTRIEAAAFHGGKAQESRLWTLDQFRKGALRVLVATDIVGRGIEVPQVSHIVLFTMQDIHEYVHKMGRVHHSGTCSPHAMVFFEYCHKEPDFAASLAAVLIASSQAVPVELKRIAQEVKEEKREVERYNPDRDNPDVRSASYSRSPSPYAMPAKLVERPQSPARRVARSQRSRSPSQLRRQPSARSQLFSRQRRRSSVPASTARFASPAADARYRHRKSVRCLVDTHRRAKRRVQQSPRASTVDTPRIPRSDGLAQGGIPGPHVALPHALPAGAGAAADPRSRTPPPRHNEATPAAKVAPHMQAAPQQQQHLALSPQVSRTLLRRGSEDNGSHAVNALPSLATVALGNVVVSPLPQKGTSLVFGLPSAAALPALMDQGTSASDIPGAAPKARPLLPQPLKKGSEAASGGTAAAAGGGEASSSASSPARVPGGAAVEALATSSSNGALVQTEDKFGKYKPRPLPQPLSQTPSRKPSLPGVHRNSSTDGLLSPLLAHLGDPISVPSIGLPDAAQLPGAEDTTGISSPPPPNVFTFDNRAARAGAEQAQAKRNEGLLEDLACKHLEAVTRNESLTSTTATGELQASCDRQKAALEQQKRDLEIEKEQLSRRGQELDLREVACRMQVKKYDEQKDQLISDKEKLEADKARWNLQFNRDRAELEAKRARQEVQMERDLAALAGKGRQQEEQLAEGYAKLERLRAEHNSAAQAFALERKNEAERRAPKENEAKDRAKEDLDHREQDLQGRESAITKRKTQVEKQEVKLKEAAKRLEDRYQKQMEKEMERYSMQREDIESMRQRHTEHVAGDRAKLQAEREAARQMTSKAEALQLEVEQSRREAERKNAEAYARLHTAQTHLQQAAASDAALERTRLDNEKQEHKVRMDQMDKREAELQKLALRLEEKQARYKERWAMGRAELVSSLWHQGERINRAYTAEVQQLREQIGAEHEKKERDYQAWARQLDADKASVERDRKEVESRREILESVKAKAEKQISQQEKKLDEREMKLKAAEEKLLLYEQDANQRQMQLNDILEMLKQREAEVEARENYAKEREKALGIEPPPFPAAVAVAPESSTPAIPATSAGPESALPASTAPVSSGQAHGHEGRAAVADATTGALARGPPLVVTTSGLADELAASPSQGSRGRSSGGGGGGCRGGGAGSARPMTGGVEAKAAPSAVVHERKQSRSRTNDRPPRVSRVARPESRARPALPSAAAANNNKRRPSALAASSSTASSSGSSGKKSRSRRAKKQRKHEK